MNTLGFESTTFRILYRLPPWQCYEEDEMINLLETKRFLNTI
jgi:hypothetical protein